MQEEWRPVVGYEGLYEVSNLGRVKSLPRKWITGKNIVMSHNGKILNQRIDAYGYLIVNFCCNGIEKRKKVHQLVAQSFLNHIPNGMNIIIDHIDNNKLNNNLINLQLVSNRYNVSKGKKSSVGYTGVRKNRNKFRSSIQINGIRINLGTFNTAIEAHLAYQNKLKEIENGK